MARLGSSGVRENLHGSQLAVQLYSWFTGLVNARHSPRIRVGRELDAGIWTVDLAQHDYALIGVRRECIWSPTFIFQIMMVRIGL